MGPRMRALILVAMIGGSALGACTNAATQGASDRGGGSVLTQEQLAATNSAIVYDAIAKLRPEWLTTRGPTSVSDATPTTASVFMNGTLLGKADYLRDVRVLDVTEVRYWAAGSASARFGMGHPRGVIELTRK